MQHINVVVKLGVIALFMTLMAGCGGGSSGQQPIAPIYPIPAYGAWTGTSVGNDINKGPIQISLVLSPLKSTDAGVLEHVHFTIVNSDGSSASYDGDFTHFGGWGGNPGQVMTDIDVIVGLQFTKNGANTIAQGFQGQLDFGSGQNVLTGQLEARTDTGSLIVYQVSLTRAS